MEKIIVQGGTPLKGTVTISGSKNAVLPIIVASLLSDGSCRIQDVPRLADVEIICDVLEELGACIRKTAAPVLDISCSNLNRFEAPYEYVSKMRASVLVMGPLLARLGRAKVSMPGGCAIGTRPIDLHLKGFEAMGVRITLEHGYVLAEAPRLAGARIYLDYPSVGATENIMMAGVLADGITVIENAAEEPEIVDLANFINSMGGRIKGAGTKIIKIEGVKELGSTTHTVIPDRIEAGSYMVAAAMTRGELLLENVIIDHLKPVIAKLLEVGSEIREEGTGLRIRHVDQLKAVDVKTMPYPGFPTDMQAQFMALMSIAHGTSILTETVFENRFMHAEELRRMGADIKTEGRSAVVEGVPRLTGAPVKASDLRAGAALIIAGLAAEGETEISNVFHIDRGYDNIVEKLRAAGARIRRKQE
ncbi:MAG: UDP-N-acetylglucosamine 1-carboxyvinyltransferase [Peptococcaceae bacterium]|nr:UDP-N-acetylglucosamine 1-carboxyvinyltransferase [Peptococcaceae bacterium]MDH7523711.1 UDP-N-acetylglucosamine 1-carboxyvinyltransferase [Peptococcaceae bacterium]